MGSVTDRPRRVVTKLLRRRTRGEPRDHLGLGAPPSPPPARDEAGEAELDTLRGELVRELDRMASGDGGSACFRRI